MEINFGYDPGGMLGAAQEEEARAARKIRDTMGAIE